MRNSKRFWQFCFLPACCWAPAREEGVAPLARPVPHMALTLTIPQEKIAADKETVGAANHHHANQRSLTTGFTPNSRSTLGGFCI